jgi:hypothetical protein
MLENLYFGKDDAESDIGRGGLLAKSFLKTSQYTDALSGKKWLVLGRKGSGKSAICLKIVADFEDSASLVTPDEISADEIKRFDLGGIESYHSKELLWRYIFCIHIAKFLLRQSDNKHPKTPSRREQVQELRTFLIENGENIDATGQELFWKIIEKLKLTLKIGVSSAVEVGGVIEFGSGVQVNDKIQEIEEKLKKLSETTFGKNPRIFKYYVLVDQVEKIWSNDPSSDALVIGLLRAVKTVQSKFNFANFLAFLRIDIYEKLNFPDRDKLRGDELHIRWDPETLIALLEKRALASAGQIAKKSALWGCIFPKHVGDQDARQFLVGRTLNRPRDIIQLANACRDIAKTRGRKWITNWDISSACRQHSKWKISDLQNEWTVNYPFLADALLLIFNSSYLFARENFNQKFSSVENDFKTRYPFLAKSMSSSFLLDVLFVVGIIGTVRNGATIYACNTDDDQRLRLEDKDFVVHPCFREALECVSAINLKPFEENPISLQAITPGRGLSRPEGVDREYYEFRDLIAATKAVKAGISKLNAPIEIKDEIVKSISIIISQIEVHESAIDTPLAADFMTKAGLYLVELEDRLCENNLASSKSDLIYELRRLSMYYREFGFGSHYSSRRLA